MQIHRKLLSPVLPFGFLLVFLLAACVSAQSTGKQQSNPSIPLADCQLSTPGMVSRLPAKCGKLSVYENRAANSGKRIELNVAVIPAVSRNPAPDPVFFIPGGPGEAATQAYLALASAFTQINQKRDIVLVDQRGTGGSNQLQCPYDPETDQAGADDQEVKVAYLQDCLKNLPGDPRFYTTAIAMDDLDDVRAALGYDKINLYGGSYGTRAALAYLRQHPERVRTVLLDGAAPPNWTLGPTISADAQRSLDLIFTRCGEQESCHAAFPNLAIEFQDILKNLQQEPVTVTLTHPINGKQVEYTLTPDTFASVVHTMSYEPETAAMLPLFIHTSYTQQDYRLFASQALSNFKTLRDSISVGMRFSVVCAEDVPFYPSTSDQSGYPGDFFMKSFQEICAVWPHGEIPDDFKNPVTSDVPVMILSGEVDPVTPPANGELTAQTLSQSLHITVPGQGHINLFRGCVPQLVQTYIESGSTAGLDTTCVQKIQPMPFFVNPNGPTP